MSAGRDVWDEVQALLVTGWRRMTPEEKLDRVAELTRAVRQLALTRLRAVHPEAEPHELELRLAALVLDRATMVHAFGWDPEGER